MTGYVCDIGMKMFTLDLKNNSRKLRRAKMLGDRGLVQLYNRIHYRTLRIQSGYTFIEESYYVLLSFSLQRQMATQYIKYDSIFLNKKYLYKHRKKLRRAII